MKKFYTLLAAACVAVGMSAQTKVTGANIADEVHDGAVIALANGQVSFGCKAWFAGVKTVTSEEPEAVPAEALMVLEAAETEGEFYIKTYADGLYVGRGEYNEGVWFDIKMVESKDEAVTHAFNVVTAANANVYGAQDEVISIVSPGDYKYTNAAGDTYDYNSLMFGGNPSLPNKFGASGNGPWKVWVMFTLSEDEVNTILNPAAPVERGQWTKTIEALDGEAPNYSAPVLATSDKGVVVAGRFNQEIEFGGESVENIATSSYVAKYDNEGNESWVVAVLGAATVKAMVELSDGSVAVAGLFADEILVGDQSLKCDDYSQNQSFIAVINAAGEVTAAKAYVATAPAASAELVDAWYLGEPSFKINSLAVQGDNLLVAATVGGDSPLEDGVLAVQDFWLAFELRVAYVFTVDAALGTETVVAKISATNDENTMANEAGVILAAATADGVCLAATATGAVTLTAGENSKAFTLGTEEVLADGIIVANIGASFNANAYTTDNEWLSPYTVNGIAVQDNAIYVAGTFKGNNPVNAELAAVGLSDLYLAKFSNTNGGRWGKAVVASGYVEGQTNTASENATCLTVDANGAATVYGYVVSDEDAVVAGIKMSTSDFAAATVAGTELIVTAVSEDVVAAYNIAGSTQTVTTQGVAAADLPDAIQSVEAGSQSVVTAVYNLSGQRVSAPKHGLYIVGGKKVVVK